MQSKDRTQIVDRREMLRVKVKSLMEEAKIIRREERRAGGLGVLYEELRRHRLLLRGEARCAHIAYGLVRGRDYKKIEANAKTEPSWLAVKRLWKRYGPAGRSEHALLEEKCPEKASR